MIQRLLILVCVLISTLMRSQEMPATLARTAFVSLLNPAFAATQLDYNKATAAYNTEGHLLGAVHVHLPRIYSAVGTFIHRTPQHTGGGVHASYHTIFLNRFHLTAGGMVYTQGGTMPEWRARYGLTLSGGRKRYWVAGWNIDQVFNANTWLPGVQWLQTIGSIRRYVALKWILTAQLHPGGRSEIYAMPLCSIRGVWQTGIGYFARPDKTDQCVTRISYKKFGWWSLLAGWPLGQRLSSTVIECCYQKSF